ncbi:hypothetical protein OIU78_014701 [Salix suchowensis]|uniref:EF-hand domain-containing protein n=2 Tax=Salix TaxID=40685 RepID=A0A5N5IY04_9ROSI|nr:hypothetical protein DKX38_030101 [Salix brachista]KAJ6288047.1 hypothetical protein OIU78_014701 [Salix suchowensis]KAJ6427943.1 hypothetical protein OIU84_023363 [Salix udensis]
MLLAARARDCITGCFRLFDTPLRRQRKLRPDPLNAAPPPSAATRCSQATLGTQPNGAHYQNDPYPFLPILHPSDLESHFSTQRSLPWPPGLDYFKFCPVHRDAGHTIEECHTLRDVIYDMNDENRINWNEVKAYLKAANVTEAIGDPY